MGSMSIEKNGKLIDNVNTMEPPDYDLKVTDRPEKIRSLKSMHPGQVAIPCGTYVIDTKFVSAKFRGRRLCLKGVPCFSSILIHEGNYPKDTQGCILVGYYRNRGVIINSRQVLQRILSKVPSGSRAEITITRKWERT